MTYQEIIQKVSDDTGVSIGVIDKTYKAFWSYIRNSIQELPLKKKLTDIEFLSLRPNFNIPSLGKLCVSLDRYKGVKNRFNQIKELINEEVD